MLPWGDASDMMRHQSGKGGCNKTSGEEVFNMGGSNEGSKTIRGEGHLFNKCYWENWAVTCKRVKLDPDFIP